MDWLVMNCCTRQLNSVSLLLGAPFLVLILTLPGAEVAAAELRPLVNLQIPMPLYLIT